MFYGSEHSKLRPTNAEYVFVESLGVFVLCWLTCWFLHRHKVYLKI